MKTSSELARDPRGNVRDRVRRGAIVLLYVFTAVTLLGFATFGVHPELLSRFPSSAGVYAVAFRFFAVSHIWLSFAVMTVVLSLSIGNRWIPAFVILYSLSLGSELAGTTTGLPFGEYRYSPLLDPMWFGHVPVVIPLSWFFMAVPSYGIALAVLPAAGNTARRVLLASAILAIWDLSLDPAMSYATRYWVWGADGPYYGMPWLNLFGWYATGLALMAALSLLRAERWIAGIPLPMLIGLYAVNLALPVGMNLAAGLWGAVGAAAVATVVVAWLATRMAGRADPAPARVPGAAVAGGAGG